MIQNKTFAMNWVNCVGNVTPIVKLNSKNFWFIHQTTVTYLNESDFHYQHTL